MKFLFAQCDPNGTAGLTKEPNQWRYDSLENTDVQKEKEWFFNSMFEKRLSDSRINAVEKP
jgi:hypothetical protein